MRRMYSEKELTDIIKKVSEDYIDELIEDGIFDQDIADYVDAYLVEHPVDITALEGQDIAPKDISATGNITAPSIIENMSGYSAEMKTITNVTIELIYAGAVKNGNKLTLVLACNLTRTDEVPAGVGALCEFVVPNSVGAKIIPASVGTYNNIVDAQGTPITSDATNFGNLLTRTRKYGNGTLQVGLTPNDMNTNLELNTKVYFRYELTLLLSDSLIS